MPSPEAFLTIVAVIVCALIGVSLLGIVREGFLRPGRLASGLVALLALFSLVIVRAPYLVGYTATEGFATLAPFIIAIAWMLCQPKRRVNRPLTLAITCFVVLFAITLYRGKSAGVGTGGTREVLDQLATVVVASAFGVLLFTTARNATDIWWRLVAVALAPAVYVGVNVALRFAGVSSTGFNPGEVSYPTGTPAKTLALIGIHTTRQAFPLNPSINGMGVLAGVGFVAACVLAMRTKGLERRAGAAGTAICLVALLLADTRAALVLAIIVVALMAVIERPRFVLLLTIAIPFSSWIIKGILSLSFWSTTGVAGLLSRRANDFGTANGRTTIWNAAQHTFATTDFFHALFGFGANGQASSGASQRYAYLFQDVPKPFFVHVHNLGLQMLLDMGAVGLIVLVVAVGLAIARLEAATRRSPGGPVPALLAGAFVVFITGSTEPSPTYRTQEALVFVILLLSAAAGLAKQPAHAAAAQRQTTTYRGSVAPTTASVSIYTPS